MTKNSRENEIFVGKAIDYRPKLPITHLKASNGEMLLALGAKQVVHIPLTNVNQQIEIFPSIPIHDRIAYLHLDGAGRHAIVSSAGGDNFYISMKVNQPKTWKRVKGHVISAVGWNADLSTENETSFFIIGTTKGCLLEASIQSNGNVVYSKDLCSNLTSEKDLPISSLELFQREDEGDKQIWIVFVCVPGRLYSFVGCINSKFAQQSAQPLVGTMWSTSLIEPVASVLQPLFTFTESPRYHCMDDAQVSPPSAFVVHPMISSGNPPTKFCWLGGHGYTTGRIDVTRSDGYSMISEDAHTEHKLVNGRFDYPLDATITEYHVLLLYSDRLEAVSLLNQKSMMEDIIRTDYGSVKGMHRDPVSQLIWVYTDSTIIRYRPEEETRNIWRIYLDRGEYGKARAITSKLKDRFPHQLVLKKEAEKYLADQNFVAAAEVLAESTDPFEVTVLKFLSNKEDRRNGLKRFLDLKLNDMMTPEDKVRRDVLVLWHLEVQLTELAELERIGKTTGIAESESGASSVSLSPTEVQLKNTRQQLELFLARPAVLEAVDSHREAVYRLMISHADFESQYFLALKLKDFDTVIGILLFQSNYLKALELLKNLHCAELYYRYSARLITKVPFELVSCWINETKILRPDLLMPALYRCQKEPKLVAAALKYISHIIQIDCADKPLHNFMINLCATYKPTDLLVYFERFGYDKLRIPYDVDFALRTCLEKPDLQRCCVHLYCVKGMYDEAVSLALTIDLELAKKCAKQMSETTPENDELFLLETSKNVFPIEVRRRIWLKIAKHVIGKEKDVAACMSLLKESDNVIKIQDVLPLFPEFTTIEHFKEPLCACLREHSIKIKDLEKEMAEATHTAEEIREDMEKLKTKYTVIRASDQCEICRELIMTRPFFSFVCRHHFHRDCLEKEVQSSWTEEERVRFTSQTLRANVLQKSIENDSKPSAQPWIRKRNMEELKEIRAELSEAIAGQCILCGDAMIESIDKPFFSEEEYAEQLLKW